MPNCSNLYKNEIGLKNSSRAVHFTIHTSLTLMHHQFACYRFGKITSALLDNAKEMTNNCIFLSRSIENRLHNKARWKSGLGSAERIKEIK